VTTRRWWTNRWLRAAAVALAVAYWPACAADEGTPAGPAVTANLDFKLKDMDGREVSLADYRGRPILLNFWATWCGPCKAETPYLVEFAERYKDKHLAVLGVSFDDTPDDIKTFAQQFKVNYPLFVGRDQDKLLEQYEATIALPVSWFIRADGAVVMKAAGIHEKAWFEEQIKAITAGSTP